MPLIYTRIAPDLLYYVEQYVVNSVVNKDKILFPSSLSSTYLTENASFIRLLFDETWPNTLTSYKFLYKLETDITSVPETIRRRMMIYPSSSTYYICDESSPSFIKIDNEYYIIDNGNHLLEEYNSTTWKNIFNLEDKDLTLLDKLLEYRIDTTSCDISEIVYDELDTNLSKLIYVYLNFKINNNYSTFDNASIISTYNNVLENFYESFIVDKIFIHLSSLGS